MLLVEIIHTQHRTQLMQELTITYCELEWQLVIIMTEEV